jgi:hypothetical protein
LYYEGFYANGWFRVPFCSLGYGLCFSRLGAGFPIFPCAHSHGSGRCASILGIATASGFRHRSCRRARSKYDFAASGSHEFE